MNDAYAVCLRIEQALLTCVCWHVVCLPAGIEIKNPELLLNPGNTSKRGEGDLLSIAMKLRLRHLPPMDMQF
jgi:hypothetical protein